MIKSVFWWQTFSHGNTLCEVVRNLKRLNVDRVEIKAADGTVAFTNPAWSAWRGKPNLTVDLVAMLHEQNIQVFGWGYNYGKYPELEGDIAAQQCVTLNLDGWIFDVETQLIDLPDAEKRVHRMMKNFRSLAHKRYAGFSSFPCWHNPNPPWPVWWKRGVWDAFAQYVDFWEPQAYWGEKWGTNAVQLPIDAILQHREIKDLPVIPAGRGWSDGAGKCTPGFIDEFVKSSRDNGAAGVSWWVSELILKDPIITEAIAQILP